MQITINDTDPSATLKAHSDYVWSHKQKEIQKRVIYFLVCIVAMLGFHFSLSSAPKDIYYSGFSFAFIFFGISLFLVWIYVRDKETFWGGIDPIMASLKEKKLVVRYTVSTAGINRNVKHLDVHYSWTAFRDYSESDNFIVLVGKKDELVNDVWLNKSFIEEEQLSVLKEKLREIFSQV